MNRPPPYDKRSLALRLGLSPDTLKRRLAGWQQQGMPAPLPWNHARKLWDHDAIERWIARRETAAGAVEKTITRVA